MLVKRVNSEMIQVTLAEAEAASLFVVLSNVVNGYSSSNRQVVGAHKLLRLLSPLLSSDAVESA